MTHQTEELISHFSEMILDTQGEHTVFEQISGFESGSEKSLIFVQNADQVEGSSIKPAVVITSEKVAKELGEHYSGFIISVANVKLAQALIKQHFDEYQSGDLEWPAIHASAVIHPDTQLGNHCRIGPNVTIGANCEIGDNVIVRANCVIEHEVKIGDDSIINSLVNIGYASIIGKRVTLQAGCIIGGEGFGFASDNDDHNYRIPHTGNVVLEDDVHIGNNTCIDRGTYGSTHIKRGVKIDNLCHIAHNVEIGEDSLIAAQCCIAGSSTIGKRVKMSGQVGVLDHKHVSDDAVLVLRAGVTEDLPHGGMWAGTPAKPFREHVLDLSASKKIARLQQDVKQLNKLLEEK